MAVVKKTYSRNNNEQSALYEHEKENFDPFDELLSSPLKQEVQFKPLSCWESNEKRLERKNTKSFKFKLYEESDSNSSPDYRRKKHRLKSSKWRGRALPARCKIDKNGNISSTSTFVKKTKSRVTPVTCDSAVSLPCEEVEELMNHSSDNSLHFGKCFAQRVDPCFVSGCDLKYVSVRKRHNVGSTGDHQKLNSVSYPRIKKNFEVDLNKNEIEQHCVGKKIKFSIYEDNYVAHENSEPAQGMAMVSTEDEKWEKTDGRVCERTLQFNRILDNCRCTYPQKHYESCDENNKSFNFTLSPAEGCDNFNETQNIFEENDKSEKFTIAVSDEKNNNMRENVENSMSYNKKKDSRNGDICFNENSNGFRTSLNCEGYLGDPNDETLTYDALDSIGSILRSDKTHLYDNCSTVSKNRTESVSVAESASADITLESSAYLNPSQLEDLIQELLLEANENSTISNASESTLISEENSLSLTDEESVIRVPVLPHTEGFGNAKELPHLTIYFPKEVSHLTTGLSHMTVSDANSPAESLEPADENSQNLQNNTRSNSVLGDFRNVTTKRRYHLNPRYKRSNSPIRAESPSPANPPVEVQKESDPDSQWELNESLESSAMADKSDFEWNKTLWFSNPVLESTRVQDVSSTESGKYSKPPTQSEKMTSLLEDSQVWREFSYSLKPGKKWLRAMSILKQIRNGNATAGRFDGSRVKGRKFESFVKDVLEMQTGEPGWSSSFADMTYSATGSARSNLKTRLLHSVNIFNSSLNLKNSVNDVTLSNSVFGMTDSEKTVLETSLINPTIKMINPDEKPSAFGLKVGDGSLDDEKSSIVSGRSYILHQCGQEDVLPFEEYFNERTLKDCKKIGEGVYGEVFMSSNSVIKIIPIEGTDRVNGEPQKKFEEILSEVVIALKLSNLRNGDKNRTDGFSEVKRCWCVRGKYPKYLLDLWDEYDRMGGGSENDSPIMFKEDQLYIILELANGGKDLESFVFTSSAQSLSIFVQTASSLAAAERAFEFEHRDLHWGNVLISPTKERFVTVTLDGIELKIPSKGVKVCIIDFTLSRIYHEGFCIFNDLSVDPGLFQSEGDYQFEIYKMMLREVKNDWSLFRPKTNIFWLHYTLDKMMTLVRYKNKKGKVHKKYERDLRILESEILDYKDSSDFVLAETMRDVIKRL